MECYGMTGWYGTPGYGMMGFNGLGILFGGLFVLVLVLALVWLIKEIGR